MKTISKSDRHRATKPANALAAFACVLLASTAMARAEDVTYERLRNPEPRNWLMNHHDYGAQRFSSRGPRNWPV